MIVLFLLIPLSIGIAVAFLIAFIWAVRGGQFEDTQTPSLRALMEEPRQQDFSTAKSQTPKDAQ